MPKMELYPIDDLVKKLDDMGRTDEIAPKMIDAGLTILLDIIKKNLQAHRRTGQLINSATKQKAKKTKTDAYYGKVKFTGYDVYSAKTERFPRGTPNEIKLLAMEVGGHGQQATPVLQKSINEAREEVLERMQQVYNIEVGDYG